MIELVAVVYLVHQGWDAGFDFESGLLVGMKSDDLVVGSADGRREPVEESEFAAVVAAVLVAEKPSTGRQRLGISVLYFRTYCLCHWISTEHWGGYEGKKVQEREESEMARKPDERLVLTTAGGRPVTRNAKQRIFLSRTRAASPTRPIPTEELLHVIVQVTK